MTEATILDENDTNILVQNPNGSTDLIPLSPRNRLIYDHGLWGLLREGTETWVHGGERRVSITPQEEGYSLQVGEFNPLQIGPHQEGKLIEALVDFYESEAEKPQGLIDLFDQKRDQQMRKEVMQKIGDLFGDAIEQTNFGWVIHDHLLLTWDRDFHHPETTSHQVNSGGVKKGASETAYNLNHIQTNKINREITTQDGSEYRLTNTEIEFLTRAIWGIENAPQGIN